ncbi:MAG: N-acetyltransferase [Cyanobacteriota bacterium]
MSLLIPFRNQNQTPLLPAGYVLLHDRPPTASEVHGLLAASGEPLRREDRWRRALERSTWHLSLRREDDRLVGFVRATSDQALNANLWDLSADRQDPHHDTLLQVLMQTSLNRLRRDLSGCSISLAAPPDTLAVLRRCGFVIDPGGIRAMGRWIGPQP